MKNGDKVKAFIQIGLMRKPRWVVGKFVEKGEDLSVIDIHGAYHTVDNNHVKKYDPLENQNVIEEFANMNWDELKDVVVRAKDAFFPSLELNFNDEEHTIAYHNVELSPTSCENESIVGFKEIPCWGIGIWKPIPATRDEPEDVDFISISDSSNNFSAAKHFIDAIWRYQTDEFWENIFYESLPEDLE